MNLHEYQSKQLLEDFGLPTAKSVVAFSVKEVSELLSELSGKEFVVKVQVHAGGRGKVGGVKITNNKDTNEKIEDTIISRQELIFNFLSIIRPFRRMQTK